MELNALKSSLDFTDPTSMCEYSIHGIDLAITDLNLQTAVNTIATDFQANFKDSFDKN